MTRRYQPYRRFSWRKLWVARDPRVIPPAVIHVGHLVGLIYRADRGTGRPHAYIHLMQHPPHLVVNPEGDQLYIVGGNYRVTSRGIEG